MINLHDRMLPTRRGSNSQPPDLHSDPSEPPRPAEILISGLRDNGLYPFNPDVIYSRKFAPLLVFSEPLAAPRQQVSDSPDAEDVEIQSDKASPAKPVPKTRVDIAPVRPSFSSGKSSVVFSYKVYSIFEEIPIIYTSVTKPKAKKCSKIPKALTSQQACKR